VLDNEQGQGDISARGVPVQILNVSTQRTGTPLCSPRDGATAWWDIVSELFLAAEKKQWLRSSANNRMSPVAAVLDPSNGTRERKGMAGFGNLLTSVWARLLSLRLVKGGGRRDHLGWLLVGGRRASASYEAAMPTAHDASTVRQRRGAQEPRRRAMAGTLG